MSRDQRERGQRCGRAAVADNGPGELVAFVVARFGELAQVNAGVRGPFPAAYCVTARAPAPPTASTSAESFLRLAR